MADFDGNGNQNTAGSGGSLGQGGTGAGVLDAFKSLSKGSGQGGTDSGQGAASAADEQKATGGEAEKGGKSPEDKEAKAELKAWGAQLSQKLRGDEEAVKTLSRFEDISSLAQSYIELEKKMSGMSSIPGENTSEEEKTAFWKKLGKPESADKYGFEQKSETERRLAEALFKADLTDAQAKAVYSFIAEAGKAQQAVFYEALKKKAVETDAALEKEFGNLLPEKMENYTKSLKVFGDGEVLKHLEETGLAYDVSMVKMFIKIGEALGESRTVTGSSAGQGGLKTLKEGGSFSFFEK